MTINCVEFNNKVNMNDYDLQIVYNETGMCKTILKLRMEKVKVPESIMIKSMTPWGCLLSGILHMSDYQFPKL